MQRKRHIDCYKLLESKRYLAKIRETMQTKTVYDKLNSRNSNVKSTMSNFNCPTGIKPDVLSLHYV